MDTYRWKTRAHNLWDSSYILLPVFPGNPIFILFWGRYRGVGEAQWAAYPTALPGPDTPETQHQRHPLGAGSYTPGPTGLAPQVGFLGL